MRTENQELPSQTSTEDRINIIISFDLSFIDLVTGFIEK